MEEVQQGWKTDGLAEAGGPGGGPLLLDHVERVRTR
jgi:hypothetical protein